MPLNFKLGHYRKVQVRNEKWLPYFLSDWLLDVDRTNPDCLPAEYSAHQMQWQCALSAPLNFKLGMREPRQSDIWAAIFCCIALIEAFVAHYAEANHTTIHSLRGRLITPNQGYVAAAFYLAVAVVLFLMRFRKSN